MSTTDDRRRPGPPARLRGLPSRLLTQAAMHADRLTTEGLAREEAHKWHYAVLASLEEFGPASQAGLSRRTGIYRSDLVAVINELAGRGLVERAPDPVDRRRNVITMTDGGRAQLGKLDELIATLQADLLEPLSEPEREQFVGLLERLNDHHGKERQLWVDGSQAST
ncbi:MarR family winged helix-turn-helix transcriptional regulator [Spirillospora sp. NPDC048911]|uniref:MarR family winged helix-turn-helix transcriptional regulator n=1 Tax=Spirillospora sp. NPDC048911 TaxID=3364527 RepID=UPI003722447A